MPHLSGEGVVSLPRWAGHPNDPNYPDYPAPNTVDGILESLREETISEKTAQDKLVMILWTEGVTEAQATAQAKSLMVGYGLKPGRPAFDIFERDERPQPLATAADAAPADAGLFRGTLDDILSFLEAGGNRVAAGKNLVDYFAIAGVGDPKSLANEWLEANYPQIGVGAIPESRAEYLASLEEQARGRESIFGATLSNQLAGRTTPGPFRSALERQFYPLQSQYLQRSGLGDIGEDPSFRKFLSAGDFTAREGLKPLARRTAGLFDPEAILDKRQQGFLQSLLDQPGMQFDIALQSVLPGIAPPFRQSYRNFLRRAFEQHQVDQPDVPYLPQFVEGFSG